MVPLEITITAPEPAREGLLHEVARANPWTQNSYRRIELHEDAGRYIDAAVRDEINAACGMKPVAATSPTVDPGKSAPPRRMAGPIRAISAGCVWDRKAEVLRYRTKIRCGHGRENTVRERLQQARADLRQAALDAVEELLSKQNIDVDVSASLSIG